MKPPILLAFLILALPFELWARHTRDTITVGARIDFVQNMGQWDGNIRFQAQLHNAAIFLEDNDLTIVLRQKPTAGIPFHHAFGHQMHAYQMHFLGANSSPTLVPHNADPSYNNYFLSNDPSHWASHVPLFHDVVYQDLYQGINLHLYAASHAFKYDFVVAPHADPARIAIRYDGIDRLFLRDGNLIVATSVGEIVELAPYAYQVINGDTIDVSSHYQLEKSTLRIALGPYNPDYTVVIDPTLYFSSYTGSTADNWGTTAAYDSYKNTYTAGLVFQIGYPITLGAYTYNGNADVGIFKFDTTGSQRLFATYLGGRHADMPHSMYVNSFDELIIFGTTGSDNFPTTPSAFDRTFNGGTELAYLCYYNSTYYRDIYYPNGSDIFVSRFSSDGSALLASTYIGGSQNDGLNYRTRYNDSPVTIMQGNDSLYFNYGDGARGEIITDDLNNIYIGSTTMSEDFPTTANCMQFHSGGKQDGVLLKIDHNLHNLLWSTYLGGEGDDAVYSIDCDNKYNVVACGGTNSRTFRVSPGCFQTAFAGGSADGFVTKVSYHGDQILGSTYFGSEAYDQCYFVRCGKSDDIFLFGQTKAPASTMIFNANYNTPNSGMLLARMNADLTERIWSTVFGTPNGKPNLSPTAFAADICNRVYAAGWGRDFVGYNDVQWNTAGTWNMSVTPDAYQSQTDGQDFYLLCLDNTASCLEYASFFGELHIADSDGGGDHVDGGTSRFDRLATLYQSVCASCGGHDGFPTTTGVWSNTNESDNCNNALFRFNVHDDFPVAEFVTPPVGCAPYTLHFHNTGRGDTYLWDFGDGTTSTEKAPSHTFATSGTYTVRLIASMPNGCKTADTAVATVKVLGNGTQSSSQISCSGEMVQIGNTPQLGCSYHWTSGHVSDSTIANPYVDEAGTYILHITSDNNACEETDTFNVSFTRLIDTLIVHSPTCPGGHDGYVEAVPSDSASGTITYIWDGTSTHDSILSGLSADGRIHRLVVRDEKCDEETTFTLSDPPSPIIEKESTSNICHDCEGSVSINAHDSLGRTYTYLWNDGSNNPERESLCQGTYIVTIQDDAGCQVNDTTTITLQHSFDNVSVWADDTTLFIGESTQIHVTPIPQGQYSWQPITGLDNPFSSDPTSTPESDITYCVTLRDTIGCTMTDSVHIHCTDVRCGTSTLFIPNAFTPNSDGLNDELCFRGEYITSFHIAIFTRWGEMVYESDDINNCWDGRFKDNWCLPGVYVYTCRIRCEGNQESLLKGDVTLIR